MIEYCFLFLAFIAGLGLGLFYFGGLWLTIQRLPGSKRPAFLALGSFFLRTALVVFAFYLIVRNGNWQNGIACIVGVIGMRMLLVRRVSLRPTTQRSPEKGS
jgi:F1F0 ATPase subunit 2